MTTDKGATVNAQEIKNLIAKVDDALDTLKQMEPRYTLLAYRLDEIDTDLRLAQAEVSG